MCFKHLYKKIFSLALILALTIPANAAVSVSDGSAFVSKAEFSTDITNLSNRMAQLENSLDAKIDSLVSSYLSRNGIWNGEKQSFENSDVHPSGRWGASDNFLSFTTKITNSTYGEASYYEEASLINNVSKSGLINITFDTVKIGDGSTSLSNYIDNGTIVNSGGNGYGAALYDWRSEAGVNGTQVIYVTTHRANGNLSVIFFENDILKETAQLCQTYSTYLSAYGAEQTNQRAIVYVFPVMTVNKYFFVNKGTKIKFRFAISFSGAVYSNTPYRPQSSSSGAYSYCGFKFSAIVY